MLKIFSRPLDLDPAREAQLKSDGTLQGRFEEVSTLRFRQYADTRGYVDMFLELRGDPTSSERLDQLAQALAHTNAEAVALAARQAPGIVRERAEIWLEKLSGSLSPISFERFRLKVLSMALEVAPQSVDTPTLSQTVFDSAQKISSVTAAMVAADFFISAKMHRAS